MSRTVRRSYLFEGAEKEKFCSLLRKQAAFSGVEILTYCVMNNHFHLLVRVPEKPLKEAGKHLIDDAELMRRYEAYYGEEVPISTYSAAELRAALSEGGKIAEDARRTVLARMGDLSVFVKELKQRFSIWFNNRYENVGTIWAERFKSVLVEDVYEVRLRVAAYIDLNPLRAGLVEELRKYPWCGGVAAFRGDTFARNGLLALLGPTAENAREAQRLYASFLSGKGPGCSGIGVRNPPPDAQTSHSDVFCESIVLGKESFVAFCRKHFAGGGSIHSRRWLGWEGLDNAGN